MCLLLLTVALASGCASWEEQPVPPDYLKFTANALPPRAEMIASVRLAALGEQTFIANGSEAFTPGSDEAPERLLAARASARRQALRTLASQILTTPVGTDRTLGQFLQDNPAQAGALEDFIETHAQVTFPEASAGQVMAEAALKGSELIALLNGRDHTGSLGDMPPETQEAVKKSTYDAALQLARDRMHIGVLEIPLKNGQRLGDVLAKQPAALRELNQMIDSAAPDETHYADDGSCELVFYIDQNKARALAQKHHRWIFF